MKKSWPSTYLVRNRVIVSLVTEGELDMEGRGRSHRLKVAQVPGGQQDRAAMDMGGHCPSLKNVPPSASFATSMCLREGQGKTANAPVTLKGALAPKMSAAGDRHKGGVRKTQATGSAQNLALCLRSGWKPSRVGG